MVIWVRGRFGLIMLMFLCTWRPQGRCSSHSYILLQDIFCHLRSLFHGKVWLSGVLCEWMSFPSYCRFGVCNYLETIGGLLPRNTFSTGPICSHLSMWHLKTHSQPSSPPSCVKPGESMKNCSSALVLCGAGLLWVFLPLWTVSCWRHIEFQMFPEECILLAVLSAVGQHVSQSIPKLALIPATFNRLWLFLTFLSLAGQNQSSMGRLTAGMLSVQFPPPRQNCDLLGVSFSVVWPLT